MKAKKNKNFVDKINGSAIIESDEGIFVRSTGELPEVFVCGDDDTARLMAAALMEAGLQIPEDVGVTGFDGVSTQGEPFQFFERTTLRQPSSEVDGTAVKRLM